MRLIDADDLLTAFPIDDEPMLTKSCVRMTIRHMPTIEPQRWIPVGEGKPKDGTVCLVTYSNGFVKIATFAEDLYEFDEYDFHGKRGVAGWCYFDDEWGMYFDVDNVIAWMPMPEPYRSET